MIEALYRLLARLGYGYPVHPPLVHMPIGLVIGALIFFAAALVLKRERLVLSARHVSVLALVAVFPTILFGVFDWIHFYHGALIPAIKCKMVLAGVLLVLLGLGIILGGEAKPRSLYMAMTYLLAFAAIVALWALGRQPRLRAGSPGLPFPRRASECRRLPPRTPSGRERADGEALFADNCASCHPGGGNVDRAQPADQGLEGSWRALEGFEAFLRAPAMPDGKPGAMPSFDEASLSDEQVEDLFPT